MNAWRSSPFLSPASWLQVVILLCCMFGASLCALANAAGAVEVFRDGARVAQLGTGTSVGEMAYLAPSAELRRHAADVLVSRPCTTVSFTPESLAKVSADCRHRFDQAFIGVLVRRLHAAHETLAHPRRIL